MRHGVPYVPVNDEAALKAALEEAAEADGVLLRVRDGHGTRYVVLELDGE
jgi:hypothetical protein